jgi:hypothetical protein
MIILISLLSDSLLPLNQTHWQLRAPHFRRAKWCVDAWGYKGVYLLAESHNILHAAGHTENIEDLNLKWQDLKGQLDEHEINQPEIFAPLGVLPGETGDSLPFEQTVYVSAAVGMCRSQSVTARN